MKKSTIIITGCDAKFFPFMEECLNSLVALNLDSRADIAVLDLGLTPEQVAMLQARGFAVKVPEWTMKVPDEIRVQHQLGLVARTGLREYFPGYNVYLWFDADAWAQTPEFFDELVEGAKAKGAGVIRENGSNYKQDWVYTKWWYGNMVASYGFIKGLKVATRPVINIGILSLSDTAPHWDAWVRYYQEFINRRGRVNNQHSFNAALELEHLPSHLAPARCNWITTLSDPYWNPETKMLCEPNAGAKPLSVVHMAGPDKKKTYQLKMPAGGVFPTDLTYNTIQGLRKN